MHSVVNIKTATFKKFSVLKALIEYLCGKVYYYEDDIRHQKYSIRGIVSCIRLQE